MERQLRAGGGLMTLDEPRQGYFLGKIVKKAKRAVKKITKSPLGKAAIIAGLGYGLGGGALATALPFFMGGDEEEVVEEAPFSETPSTISDIVEQARNRDPSLRFLPEPQFVRNFYRKADGGIIDVPRIPMQEGGIMDLGGMEKDYRTGGFVELGAEERADDVPARLSKNEFVFTADAVRNAGGGDIDEGARVMQNMMDNLEAGGMISEESQGMNPAQEMFDQAQMMEGRLA